MDREQVWREYQIKKFELLRTGFKTGLVKKYNQELIQRLRNIYYEGIPASIILLTMHLTNGYCYDRSILLAEALLDDNTDINLIYANINSLRLNPNINNSTVEHCIVEQIIPNKTELIYDTSQGLVFNESLYWQIESPQVTKIATKEAIIDFLESGNNDSTFNSRNFNILLPSIIDYSRLDDEIYSIGENAPLKKEIEYFKTKMINSK